MPNNADSAYLQVHRSALPKEKKNRVVPTQQTALEWCGRGGYTNVPRGEEYINVQREEGREGKGGLKILHLSP